MLSFLFVELNPDSTHLQPGIGIFVFHTDMTVCELDMADVDRKTAPRFAFVAIVTHETKGEPRPPNVPGDLKTRRDTELDASNFQVEGLGPKR